jgi:photosystem II stability/assembly factor-like uncharacterized protein
MKRSFQPSHLSALILVVFLATNHVNAQWLEKNNGLWGAYVSSIIVTGSSWFAGTARGLYKTTDEGEHWSWVNLGITQVEVTSLAVNGTNIFLGSVNQGLFISNDNGISWKSGRNLPASGSVYSLFFANGKLFATTNSVYVSSDNGNTWVSASEGLPEFGARSFASSGNNLFAGTYKGVFVSNNNGITWLPANTNMQSASVTSIAVLGNDLYASTNNLGTLGQGVLKSNDNGLTWSPINKGLSDLFVTCLFLSSGNLIAGTQSGGIFQYLNANDSWSAINNGITNRNGVTTLLASGSKWIAGSSGSGIYVSIDQGKVWKTSNEGFTNAKISSIVFIDNYLFAYADGAGIYSTSNLGDSWTPITVPDQLAFFLGTSGNILFASTQNLGLLKSSDFGLNWSPSNSGLEGYGNSIMSIYTSPGAIYVGVNNGKLFKSVNSGASWQLLGTIPNFQNVTSFTIKNSNIYAATNNGAYISKDNGTTWVSLNPRLSNIGITAIVTSGENIFAASNSGLYISKDDGSTWTEVSLGTSSSIYSLTTYGNSIFAGTQGGVYFSPNTGINWELLAQNLVNDAVTSILATNNKVFVGSNRAGVWSRPLTDFKLSQEIIFPALADKTFGDGAFNLAGSASSSLPVSFATTSDKISIANGQVTLLKAGRVSITASQVGNENYKVASSITQSFCIKPAKPTITLSNLTTPTSLLTSSAADGNQWYVDGTAIAGATNATFSATKSGSYKVQVTIDDCKGEFSAEQPLVITGTEAVQASIDLYPNPVGDLLTIYFGDAAGMKQITVFALTGERLVTNNTESSSITIDVSNLSTGIYLTKILVDGAVQTKKFKKQ